LGETRGFAENFIARFKGLIQKLDTFNFPVKNEATFDLPGPEIDSHGNVIGDSGPLITTLDDHMQTSFNNHIQKAETTRSVKALEKAGFKFTDYQER
jgi:hypothetical protein